MMFSKTSLSSALALTASALILAACGATTGGTSAYETDIASAGPVPASKFDLSKWYITVPTDTNRDGKVDNISVANIQTYSHKDYFYIDEAGRMVFASPNKALTTANSSNTRSELRYMHRGTNTKIKTSGAANNMAVEARKDSDKFGSVGGKMEATLRVDQVSTNAGRPDKFPAYSAVIGQIHATSYDDTSSGFGYGNEPIKIYYKKWPNHDTGSVFWNYERNLPKDDPNRTDIAYPVWGNTWENPADPGANGIRLGEDFSYTINVYKNTMYLTFSSPRLGTKTYTKSLVSNRDAYGKVDELDNKLSYGGDMLYFKAGIYNQCSTSDADGFWYAACPGTGDWATDKADGNYAQASFSRLVVGPSTPQ